MRSKRGFGMLELIIVLAVVAALGTVGVVEVAKTKQTLHQKELDSYAEIMYHAEQSRLTELRTSGRESEYQPSDGSTNELLSYAEGFVPCDLTDAAAADKAGFSNGEMRYLVVPTEASGKRTQLANILMPENRDDAALWSGSWVVEFNHKTGMVYSIFFSETDIVYAADQFDALREFDARRESKDPKVGYYSSGAANTEEDAAHLEPTVTVTNGDTLTAAFTCPVPTGFSDDIKFYYSIVQEDGNWTYIGETEAVSSQNGGAYTYALTMDDPLGGKAFKDLWKNGTGTLITGSNMTIYLEAAGVNKPTTSDQDTDKFNSLFADSSKSPKAEIENPRHLQNLNPGTSGVTPVSEAKLLKNITWPKQPAFTPINNENLKTFDGNDKQIEDLSDSLFDQFKGDEVKNLQLVDPKVYNKLDNDNTGYAGALARVFTGNSKGAKITNVCAYLVKNKPSLESDQYDKVLNDSDFPKAIVATKRGAGGLIGKANGSKIVMTNCYAALTIQGRDSAGGLIAQIFKADVTMKNCYSDSYVFGKNAGGLIGLINGSDSDHGVANIQSCYAAGYMYGNNATKGTQAGIAYVNTTSGELTAKSGYTVCEFMGVGTNFATVNSGSIDGIYYLYKEGTAKGTQITAQQKKSISEFAAVLGGAFDSKAQRSNAYNLLDQNLPDSYEYPGIVELPHYGDWGPLNSGAEVELILKSDERTVWSSTVVPNNSVNTLAEVKGGDGTGTAYKDTTFTHIPARYQGTPYQLDGWYTAKDETAVKVLNADGSVCAEAQNVEGFTKNGKISLPDTGAVLYAKWYYTYSRYELVNGFYRDTDGNLDIAYNDNYIIVVKEKDEVTTGTEYALSRLYLNQDDTEIRSAKVEVNNDGKFYIEAPSGGSEVWKAKFGPNFRDTNIFSFTYDPISGYMLYDPQEEPNEEYANALVSRWTGRMDSTLAFIYSLDTKDSSEFSQHFNTTNDLGRLSWHYNSASHVLFFGDSAFTITQGKYLHLNSGKNITIFSRNYPTIKSHTFLYRETETVRKEYTFEEATSLTLYNGGADGSNTFLGNYDLSGTETSVGALKELSGSGNTLSSRVTGIRSKYYDSVELPLYFSGWVMSYGESGTNQTGTVVSSKQDFSDVTVQQLKEIAEANGGGLTLYARYAINDIFGRAYEFEDSGKYLIEYAKNYDKEIALVRAEEETSNGLADKTTDINSDVTVNGARFYLASEFDGETTKELVWTATGDAENGFLLGNNGTYMYINDVPKESWKVWETWKPLHCKAANTSTKWWYDSATNAVYGKKDGNSNKAYILYDLNNAHWLFDVYYKQKDNFYLYRYCDVLYFYD